MINTNVYWRVTAARGVAVGAMCVGALAGCTSTTSGTAVPPSPSAGTSSPSATATLPARPGTVLERIALRSSDLVGGARLKLYEGGDQVEGQVTLDNCGYDFTSETDRVARRQYGVVDSAGETTGTSNEVVAYDSAAHAAAALNQIHVAAATCPKKPVRSTVAGVPTLTYRVAQNRLGVSALPTTMNALVVESASGEGETLYNVSVYQVHGRYLDAVYVNSDSATTSVDVDAAVKLAAITGRRLAAVN